MMGKRSAPFGSWRSPLSAAQAVSAGVADASLVGDA